MTGKRVEEFVEDVSRIAAIEHLLHEQLDEMGDAITKETRTFNYVASFNESRQGSIAIDEYRQEHMGIADFPDQISSSGFATLALVFHPKMRDSFEMVCEGLRRAENSAHLPGKALQTAGRSVRHKCTTTGWRPAVPRSSRAEL
jgi:hypothetical protein